MSERQKQKQNVPGQHRERAFPVGSHQVGFLVSSDRNVNGLGPPYSSGQKRIMEMQCDLLISSFETYNKNDCACEREHKTRL